MLRKTAAIAVLILIVSSFTLGSAVRIETAGTAGNAEDTLGKIPVKGQLAGPGTGPVTSSSYMLKNGEGVTMGFVSTATVPAGEVASMYPPPLPPDGFYGSAGAVMVKDGAGEGNVTQLQWQTAEGNYASVVVYMNEIRVERLTGHNLTLVTHENKSSAGYAFHARTPGDRAPDLTFVGKVGMMWPGAVMEFYDFQMMPVPGEWPAENGSLAHFSGKMTIPARNGSYEKDLPPGVKFDADTGAIEISSDMMVDLANLPEDVVQTDDTYNHHISAGETNWHTASVGEAIKSLNVDLKWADPDGKLRLMIYTPDGKVLGPYYDDSDGRTDGRINLNVTSPSGVATGEWDLKVTDMTTLGDTDYYMRTY